MKYFYHMSGPGALNADEFIEATQVEGEGQTYVIDESVQFVVKTSIKAFKNKLTAFANCAFQLTGEKNEQLYYTVDAKGAVTQLTDKPDWALSVSDINQKRLMGMYDLEQLSFMEGIKKLSEQPVDTVQAILKGLLPNLQLRESSQEGSQADSGKTDKKPRIQNLTAEQFKDFYDLMASAVKKKKLPSMGYFVDNGVIDPDLKRGFRTYYKIVAGQNMKPDNFTPGDAYFAEISKRLDAIKSEGVDRSYNAISSNISKLDADLPISELTYRFNDWDSN
ncbi:hypothetical protein [Pantoea dispersa]|uniref:hypothetical protein n=1 Tax=Pantoea dispersa TaxID=59814 RepID=UPI0024AFEEAC|nr:hypothetical protein [Pantoea dispersa]MDI6637111.1 hypothetical protein [Pantoea dispersa]